MAIPEQTERKKRKKKLQHRGDEEEQKKKKKGRGLPAPDAIVPHQVDGKKKKGKPLNDDVVRAEDGGKMRKRKKKKKRLKESQQGEAEGEPRGKASGAKKHEKRRGGSGEEEGKVAGGRRNLITDARFAAAHSDPRFQRMPQRESKVSIDSRFSRLFSDKSYASSSAPVDKRGKPRKGKGENPLAHYYLREEASTASVEEHGKEAKGALQSGKESEPSTTEEELVDESGVDSDMSSSTDEEDGDDDDYQYGVESDAYKFWIGSQEETPTIENETRRLAVVNMDWDHIKAVDLYVLMSTSLLASCPQSGGQVLSVTVYPSEFGLKCMEVEAARGPHALIDGENGHGGDADDDDIDDEIANEKIRSYQLQRLKYYYAVVECDSSATANHLYNALDGVEFLRTANVLDLRFIPDSMDFQHHPRDVATEAPADYTQPDFETVALQHSTVKLTWDDDEPTRKKILRRKFNPDKMDELEQYLASEESDEEDDDGGGGGGGGEEKYQALLRAADGSGSSEEEDDGDGGGGKEMEVTFLPGVENLSRHIEKSKLKKPEETVWEAALRRRREKMKARRKNAAGEEDDDDEDEEEEDDHSPPPEQGEEDDFFAEEVAAAAPPPARKSRQSGRRSSPEAGVGGEASAAELELLLADDGGAEAAEHLKGFNLRPKKKGKKGKKKLPMEDKLPEMDAGGDPRFLSRLSSSLYALDPTDPQFKRSAASLRQEHAEKKRKGKGRGIVAATAEDERESPPAAAAATSAAEQQPPAKEKQEIMSLVRSLKLKSKGQRTAG